MQAFSIICFDFTVNKYNNDLNKNDQINSFTIFLIIKAYS